MGARAIWKGTLRISGLSVPVKLYSAVADRTVRFHIVEPATHSRVKQHMVDPATEEEVPREKIQKGYEVEPGRFVVLREEELRQLEPPPSRDIEIRRFVPPEEISHEWYDRPYYLGPDGEEEAYFALAEALEDGNREGVAHWVMRKKRYFGALRAEGGYLMLIALRHASEVISAKDLPAPRGRPLDAREVQMAVQLVSALEGEFRPEDFRDEYRARVEQLVEAKAAGKAPKLPTVKPRKAEPSLVEALSKSLESARRKKVA